MSAQRCPDCDHLVEVVPWVPVEEIGNEPQWLRKHRKDGRAFAGPFCPGSLAPVKVWATPPRRAS